MPRTHDKQSAAYHNIANAKYAVRDADGKHGETVVDFAFAKSASFDPQVETQAVFANGGQILSLVSDNGYTGGFGTTAPDRDFEKAVGQAAELNEGLATLKLIGMKRFDFYYEYQEITVNQVTFTVKVWVLNVEAAKPSLNNETSTTTATIGAYSYPITVYGEKIKAAAGGEYYRDENGNELYAVRIVSMPGDPGYTEFEKTVPTPTMLATAPTPPTEP